MHREGGVDGALGVVLVGDRRPKDRHHRIPNVFLDGAAEALDVARRGSEIVRQVVAEVLGVEALAERRRIGEISEEDADETAALAEVDQWIRRDL